LLNIPRHIVSYRYHVVNWRHCDCSSTEIWTHWTADFR